MADRRADPGELARRDRGADARAADEDAALRLAAADRLAELPRLVGVVDPGLVGSVPRSTGSCPSRCSSSRNALAELDAPVVERHRDLHRSTDPRFTVSHEGEVEPNDSNSGASSASSCGSTPSARARRRAPGHPTSHVRRRPRWPSSSPSTSATTSTSRRARTTTGSIFSKGHASPLVYAMFRAAGAISEEELLTYRQFGSRLEGHPTPRHPLGRRRHRLARPGAARSAVGMALAGKRLDRLPFRVWVLCGDSEMAEGSMWEALEHAALLRARQPDGDHRRQPAGPARRDDARLGPRLLLRPRARLRLARDRDRRPRRRGRSTPPTPRRSTTTGEADRDRREDDQGQGRSRGSRTRAAGTARRSTPEEAIAELGGVRNITSTSRSRSTASRTRSEPAPLELPELRARLRGRDAQGVRRRARRARRGARRVVALDGEVSNSTFAEIFRDAHPERLLRDVHRGAADDRRRGGNAGARLEAVRLDVRRLPHPRLRLRPHGGDQPREPLAVRLARRRLDRRGRPVADGARGHRRVPRDPRLDRALPLRRRTRPRSSSRTMADLEGISYLRTTRARHAGDLRGRRGVPESAAARPCARRATT